MFPTKRSLEGNLEGDLTLYLAAWTTLDLSETVARIIVERWPTVEWEEQMALMGREVGWSKEKVKAFFQDPDRIQLRTVAFMLAKLGYATEVSVKKLEKLT